MKHNYVYVTPGGQTHSTSYDEPSAGGLGYLFDFDSQQIAQHVLEKIDRFEKKAEAIVVDIAGNLVKAATPAIKSDNPRRHRYIRSTDAKIVDMFPAQEAEIETAPVANRISKISNKSLFIGLALAASAAFAAVHYITANKHHKSAFPNRTEWTYTDPSALKNNAVATDIVSGDDAEEVPAHWYSRLLARADHAPLNAEHYYEHLRSSEGAGYRYSSRASHVFLSDKERLEGVIQTDTRFASKSFDDAFWNIKDKLESGKTSVLEIGSPLAKVDLNDIQINSAYAYRTLASMGQYHYFHPGSDLQAEVGDPVRVAIKGGGIVSKIFYIGRSAPGMVEVTTPSGVIEMDMHVIPDPGLVLGQHVDQGQVVASVSPQDNESEGKNLDLRFRIGPLLGRDHHTGLPLTHYLNSTQALRSGYLSVDAAGALTETLGRSLVGKIRAAKTPEELRASLESDSHGLGHFSYASVSEDFKADYMNFLVDEIEGGTNPAIDNNGALVRGGLNQAANPEVDVRSMSREEIIQHLLTKYINPATQGINSPGLFAVVGQAVMLSPGTVDDLLERSGGDPYLFLELQQQNLQNLHASEEVHRAWRYRGLQMKSYLEKLGVPVMANAPDDSDGAKVKTPPHKQDSRHRSVEIQLPVRNSVEPDEQQPLEKPPALHQFNQNSLMANSNSTIPGLKYRYIPA
jgi:hypothetical protein